MLKDTARGISGLFVERILAGAALSLGELPRPSGDPHVHAMGPDPDRILMIGGAPVRGVGVASHELGIGGYLARRLSALTGRGADVELLGVPGLTTNGAARLLAEVELARFDAIVVMLGGREALALRPAGAWARDIRMFLGSVAASAPPTLSVFVVGIAPLPSVMPLSRFFGPMVGRHVVRLNAVTAAVCEETGSYFIPFEPGHGPEHARPGQTGTYVAWAEPIALEMYRSLDAAVSVPHTRSVADEEARQAALDAMGILDTQPSPAVDALTRVARDLFGVVGASVNLTDRDRQNMHSTFGFEKGDVPRSESFCAVTVDLGGALVVEDALRDTRFNTLDAVTQGGIRFYAGYPVEAPNGQRVGTLCLFDTEPREFTSADRSLLRELALRVQAELWARARVSVP